MIFAEIGNTPYKLMMLLHVLTAIVAFAPVFSDAFLARQGSASGNSLMGVAAANTRRIHAPALLLNGVFGFGLAGMSDKVYSMSDPWLATAFILWVAMNGLLHAIVIPGEKAIAAGGSTSGSVASRVAAASAGNSILLVIMLYLMIFKPGA